MLVDLDRALRTAEARPHVLVLPRHRLAGSQVIVEQVLQGGATGQIHREQLVHAITHRRTVAEHQLHFGSHRHARAGQCVGVRGELKEGLDLHRPRELGVPQPIALPLEHEKVGEADEPAVEHRRLIDDRRPAFDGAHGRLRGGGQPVDRVLGPSDDRDVLLGEFAKLVQVALLVLAAEFGRAGEQFVFDRDRRPPAELGVERAQQRVLAAGGGREVGGAVDHSIVGDEHVRNCM